METPNGRLREVGPEIAWYICKLRNAKNFWQPSETRREAWKRHSLRASRRKLTLPTL